MSGSGGSGWSVVAAVAGVVAVIVTVGYGEIQRRLARRQLLLAQEQAELQPKLEVSEMQLITLRDAGLDDGYMVSYQQAKVQRELDIQQGVQTRHSAGCATDQSSTPGQGSAVQALQSRQGCHDPCGREAFPRACLSTTPGYGIAYGRSASLWGERRAKGRVLRSEDVASGGAAFAWRRTSNLRRRSLRSHRRPDNCHLRVCECRRRYAVKRRGALRCVAGVDALPNSPKLGYRIVHRKLLSEPRESPVPKREGESPAPEEPRTWWRRWFQSR